MGVEAEVGKYISGQETGEAQMLVAVGAGEPHRGYVFPGLTSSRPLLLRQTSKMCRHPIYLQILQGYWALLWLGS